MNEDRTHDQLGERHRESAVGGNIVTLEKSSSKRRLLPTSIVIVLLLVAAIGLSPIGHSIAKGTLSLISDAAENHVMKRDVPEP